MIRPPRIFTRTATLFPSPPLFRSDMAARLPREAGDRVLAVETDRGILLTPYDPDVEAGLAVAAHAAKKFRNALRELAK